MSTSVVRPSAPYQGPIPGGLRVGKVIEVRGSVHQEGRWFEIDLCVGEDDWCERTLCLSVRLNSREVVRSTKVPKSQGTPGTQGTYPFENTETDGNETFSFSNGREFTVMIVVEPTYYKITTNGKESFTFNHRKPVESVRTIRVAGDVDIERIQFI